MFKYLVLGMTSLCFCVFTGCESGSTSTTYSSPSSSSSQVMSEGQRSAVVDNMVGQGATREDADAFTKALNEAQRDWENNQ